MQKITLHLEKRRVINCSLLSFSRAFIINDDEASSISRRILVIIINDENWNKARVEYIY